MSNQKDGTIRIVRGEDRFAGSSNIDQSIPIQLTGDKKNYVEGDRSKVVNLQERFNLERFNSNKYRIAGKIVNVFENTISGKTSYEPFRNNMYYLNALDAVENGSEWKGYPQFDEFTFYRTRGIENHVDYSPMSATTYNWMTYITYCHDKDYEQSARVTFEIGDDTFTHNFFVGDGVPFYNKTLKINGKNLTFFYCGFNHNLSEGDWIRLKTPINEKTDFEVYRLGDVSYGNEDKVFCIYNFGYDGFSDNNIGNFKRIINIKNDEETLSEYYVRLHKTLTTNTEHDIHKMGFENNIFNINKKFEYASLTPNNVERISIKDGSQTVGFSFDRDIDISGIKDHLGRPVTELFVTIINKGYMGFFNKPFFGSGLQTGWDFNFTVNNVDNWWNINNQKNVSNIPVDSYEKDGLTFYYNKNLELGHVLKGDICEYNQYEQQEVVLSKNYHKYSFNYNIMNNNSPNTLPDGYAYIPHYSVPIKVFSDYVETGDKEKVDLIPEYAFYSQYDREWRWRDTYISGFIDSSGNGLDIPFLNGAHYPFKDILFLQIPIKKSASVYNDIIYPPIVDDCE